ncbi:MAG: ABC transporter substrate binding protein, partial [Chthoniobacterales bacterium]
TDPVGSGFVKSFPRPGGNFTGFVNLEGGMVEKWLELLKEIAPQTNRVGVMFNPKTVGVDGPRGIWCHSCAVNTQLRSRP